MSRKITNIILITCESLAYLAFVAGLILGGYALMFPNAFDEPIPIERIERLDLTQGGWHPEAVRQLADWRESLDRFCICSASTGEPVTQDNRSANVRLWKLTALQVGQPPPNGPQLTGDCTSWATAHAIEGTQSGQMAAGELGQWQRIFPPWLYGAGRVWIWKKEISSPLPSQGCSVGAVMRAAQEFGVITWDQAEAAGYRYSGSLADDWGRRGPPASLKPLAAGHRLHSVAACKSAADVRDAICNGYGVAVGSDFTAGNFRTLDGRLVADNIAPRLSMNGRWHHALLIDGYDGTCPSGPKYHIQNSWYPNSHPAPVDDSPVCSFWVDESAVEYMCRQDDCYTAAGFDGFVDRRNDVDLFSVSPSAGWQTIPSQPSKTQVAP